MSINDIQLCRKDLHQVTCVTGRSLGVLGTDKKKCQRVIVGADNGVITCFRMKKGAPEVEFETGNLDYPVSRLMIGGPVDKKDRIFFTSAQTIRGVTRKGKEFFRFTTDGAEPLRGLHVEDVKIWTSGEYMYNYYVDTKDAGYYMARDRINDLLIEPIINRVDGNAILGCQDRYVRVLDVNKLHYEAFVQGAVQSLSRFSDVKYSDVLKQVKEVPVIFGTDNGLLGELRMGTDSIRPGWLVQNVRGLGSITSVVPCDLTKNGLDDIIVGRDDGEIQVFSLEDAGADGMQPTQIIAKNINECVQGLQVGTVCTTAFAEVVVASYSGRISSFTTEPSTDAGMQAFAAAPTRIKEMTLQTELAPTPEGKPELGMPEDDNAEKEKGDGKEKEKAKGDGKEKEKKKSSSSIKSFFGFKKKEKAEKEEKDKFVAGLVVDRQTPAASTLSSVSGILAADADGEVTRSDPKESVSKLAALRSDIATLREQVKTQKAAFEKMSKESVPVSTRSKIKSTLMLDADTGSHKLTLESEMPMDLVALEGCPGLELILLDSGSSVPSISPATPAAAAAGRGGSPSKAVGGGKPLPVFLATLRMQGTTNRLQVQLMISEGTGGSLTAYVVTRVAPKVVHLVENHVHPLSLHRTVPLDAPLPARPTGAPAAESAAAAAAEPASELRIQGSFTTSQMHAWLRTCFRDIPSKVPEADESGMVRYKFESAYCGSTVTCGYNKGEAVFRSANLSVLATIKDTISRDATQMKVKLDVRSPTTDEKGVVCVLELLHPKLTKLLKLKESIKYIEAVKELATTPEDRDMLSPELLQVLDKADELRAAHKDNEKHIAFIEKVLEQLFVDRFKFKGINVKHRIGEVQQLVSEYSWQGLLALFAAA